MSDLLGETQVSVLMEYNRAAEKFGKAHNSPHEGYAVILEEYEEAQQESDMFLRELEYYWGSVKRNSTFSDDTLENMQAYAMRAAAEWIQVAAMCYKAMKGKEDEDS